MCLFALFRRNVKKRDWENCCKAPKAMKIDPPLPDDYTAWIHRAGWVLYVHEPSQSGSWMHPVKLANLQARGLKGPSKIGPEMYVWEKNVNNGGHYIVDYAYPPRGKIVSASRPTPGDFKNIDRMGWDAWNAQGVAEDKAYHQKYDKFACDPTRGFPPEFWAMRRQVMREQGIISNRGREDDAISARSAATV